MKPKFRYHRDEANRPLVTECSIIDNEGNQTGWGIAICSPSDNPCKATGRKIALQRAQHGAKVGQSLQINRSEAREVLFNVVGHPHSQKFKANIWGLL